VQLSVAILWSSGSRSHRDQISGGHSVGVPPVPIPNTAVKPDSAKDSRTAGSRKRRTSPDYFPPAPPSHQRDRGAGRLTHPSTSPHLPQALHAPPAHQRANADRPNLGYAHLGQTTLPNPAETTLTQTTSATCSDHALAREIRTSRTTAGTDATTKHTIAALQPRLRGVRLVTYYLLLADAMLVVPAVSPVRVTR
jgi:hypothetical protein